MFGKNVRNKGNNAPSLRIQWQMKKRMRPGHCLGLVLQVSFSAFGWMTGRTCGPLKTCASSHKGSLLAQVKEENWREPSEPVASGKWLLKLR